LSLSNLTKYPSAKSCCFALLGGWLGSELVYRLSVGVDFEAHVNSPSSLSSRPASDNKETLAASQRG